MHTPEHVHSKCDYGEFPLCFAAAVGNERICNQLFNHYIRRVDRMIALSRALEKGNWREIDSRLFTQIEASPGRLDFQGGQLFTRQQVRDFEREMTEWIDGEREAGIEEYKKLLQSVFINRQTSKGNTALHLAISMGNTALPEHMSAVDWLLKSRAEPSMSMLNIDNLTPVTLAARMGAASMLIHLIDKHKITPWVYGSVALKFTDLQQFDTFKIKRVDDVPLMPPTKDSVESLAHVEAHLLPKEHVQVQRAKQCDGSVAGESKEKPGMADDQMAHHQMRSNNLAKSFKRYAKFAQERFEGKTLHEHAKWRCALEIVVRHEIRALLSLATKRSGGIYNLDEDEQEEEHITLFEDLIAEKWQTFALWHHLIWHLFPHIVILGLYMALVILRLSLLYEERFDVRFDQDFLVGWKFDYSFEHKMTLFNGYCPAVLLLSIPFLLLKSLQTSRVSALDLDPNEDRVLSFTEILLFGYKNLGSLLNATAGAAMFAQVVVFFETRDMNRECQIMAIVILLLWGTLLQLFVPFKMAGSMLIIVWRMIFSDMSQFFSVYVLILLAFSISSYVLVVNHHLQEGIAMAEDEWGHTDAFGGHVLR